MQELNCNKVKKNPTQNSNWSKHTSVIIKINWTSYETLCDRHFIVLKSACLAILLCLFVVYEDSQRLLFVLFLYVPGVLHQEERGISATPAQTMWRHTVSVAPDISEDHSYPEYWIFLCKKKSRGVKGDKRGMKVVNRSVTLYLLVYTQWVGWFVGMWPTT